MNIKGYPLFWYLSSMGRMQFGGVESYPVRKTYQLDRHLEFLYYGSSRKLARVLSWPNGMNIYVPFKELGYIQFVRLNIIYLRRNKLFGHKLKRFEINNYYKLFKIRTRRGKRLLQGLPVHGTSHTNAITAYRQGKKRRVEVFSGRDIKKGTRLERKTRYLALLERNKAKKIQAGKQKVRHLLRKVKLKQKAKVKAKVWIMSKQKAQMERARKKWQAIAAKKHQQRFRKW